MSRRHLIALSPLLILAACNADTSSGLTVNARLGPDVANADTCAQFDVQTIRAVLGDDEYQASADCGDDVVFSDVPAGRWALSVQAIDSAGFTVLDNGAEDERVELRAGNVQEHVSQLTATPATVFVRWATQIGGFQANCNDPMLDTDRFVVEAWDDIGTQLISATFDCDAMADPEVGSSYRRVPDPDRAIKGNLLREVSVRVMSSSGDELPPTPRFPLDAPPGPGRALYLTIQCDDNTCQSTGDPPYDTP